MEGSLVSHQVSNFAHHGVIISNDRSMDRELSARIWQASGAFNQLSNIWKNRNIQTNTKIRIYKAAVLTILLYGSEVWNTTKKQHHRLEVFHQRCLRRILRIKWYHRTRNADVLERARINPIETYVGANRLRWFGHVSRMPDTRMPQYFLKWTSTHFRRICYSATSLFLEKWLREISITSSTALKGCPEFTTVTTVINLVIAAF